MAKVDAEKFKDFFKEREAEYINIEAIKQENKDLKFLVEQYKFLVEQLNTPIIVSAAPDRSRCKHEDCDILDCKDCVIYR